MMAETIQEEAPKGGVSVAEARPDRMTWLWLFFGQVFLFMAAYGLIVEGIMGAMLTAAVMAFAIGWAYVITLFLLRVRAEWDDDGVVLKARNGTWLKPLLFLWSEVVEARPSGMMPGAWVIRLDRPHKFLAFRPQPRKIVIQPALGRDPRFVEALRSHVAGDRFHEEEKRFWKHLKEARKVLPYVVIFCCGVVVWSLFRCMKGAGGSPFNIAGVMAAGLGYWIGSMAVIFYYGESPLGGLMSGCLCAFLFVEHRVVLLAALAGRNDVAAGSLGLTAGLLAGAALLMFVAGRKGRLRLAPVFYVFGVAGLLAGLWGFGGVSGAKVGKGSLPRSGNPWTPSGDAFFIVEKNELDVSETPTAVRWYSADLRPGIPSMLPITPDRVAVGEEYAFCTLSFDDRDDLYLVQRGGGDAALVDSGKDLWNLVASPDRSALLYRFEEMPPESWRLFEVANNGTREVQLLLPASDIRQLRWLKDGSLQWIERKEPADEKTLKAGASLCVFRTWKLGAPEPSTRYVSAEPWLSSHVSADGNRAAFQRWDDKTNQWEWAAVNLSEKPPTIAAVEGWEAVENRWGNDRFVVSGVTFLDTRSIVDRESGKSFRLNGGGAMVSHVEFSPDGRRLLYTGVQWTPEGGLLAWKRSVEGILQFKSVVYVLEMD
jgi:hypothetical protein